jgi:hypothetical protein
MDLDGKAFTIKIDNPDTPEIALPIKVYSLSAFGRHPDTGQAPAMAAPAVPPAVPPAAPAPVALPEAARQVVETPAAPAPAQP